MAPVLKGSQFPDFPAFSLMIWVPAFAGMSGN